MVAEAARRIATVCVASKAIPIGCLRVCMRWPWSSSLIVFLQFSHSKWGRKKCFFEGRVPFQMAAKALLTLVRNIIFLHPNKCGIHCSRVLRFTEVSGRKLIQCCFRFDPLFMSHTPAFYKGQRPFPEMRCFAVFH